MEFDFLSRLYCVSSSEHGFPVNEEDLLGPLYQRIPDVETSIAAFWGVLDTLGIGDTPGTISNAALSLAQEYERQGFINGVRFGMMLARELRQVENGQTAEAPLCDRGQPVYKL